MRRIAFASCLAAATLALSGCEQKPAAPAAPASSVAAPEPVASVSAEEAVTVGKTRHDNFKQIGGAMKSIGDQLKSGAPDAAKVAAAAATINRLAPDVKTWFPAGTGPDVLPKTQALPAIWEKPAEFQQAAAKLADEAAKFDALAKAGDMAAVGDGMKALGGACKGCHDQFKAKDKDHD